MVEQTANQLTPDAQKILCEIHRYYTENKVPPSRRNLRDKTGVRSFTNLHTAIELLLRHRLIERTKPMQARNLLVTSLGRGVIAHLQQHTQQTLVFA